MMGQTLSQNEASIEMIHPSVSDISNSHADLRYTFDFVILYYVCVCFGGSVSHVWRSEDNMTRLSLSFHHVVTRVGILACCAGLIFIFNIYKFNK